MDSLPVITAFHELSQVTFYEWRSLTQCVLKGMSKALTLSSPLPQEPPTREVLIGRFHHAVMHLAATANSHRELANGVEAQIEAMQAEVDGWPHLRKYGSVSGWDAVNASATLALSRSPSGKTADPNAIAASEGALISKDGQCSGRPDAFVIRGTSAILREYKSGSIRDQMTGAIKDEYTDQLYFYAGLICDHYPVDTVTGRLESLTGDITETLIDRASATAFGLRVRGDIRNANERIRAASAPQELAAVSKEACNHCDKQLLCHKYRREQSALHLPGDQGVIAGRLVKHVPRVGGRTVEISLEDECVTLRIDIPANLARSVTVGSQYLLSGLQLSGGHVRWTFVSRMFALD
jgi:PD-(D/E)XK nuclease superfamily